MPSIGEIAFRFNAFHQHLHGEMLVPGMGDLAANGGALDERTLELHAEPCAELLRIGDGAPYTGPWRAKGHALLDTIIISHADMQPPGCNTIMRLPHMQPLSCPKSATCLPTARRNHRRPNARFQI